MPSRISKKLKNSQHKGLNFILSGLVLILLFVLWKTNQRSPYYFNVQKNSVQTEVQKGSLPVKIEIPSLKLRLDVKEAAIRNNEWQVWQDAANHLSSSADLGGGGNIVIYGHNKNSMLGPIRWLFLGDILKLTGQNGKEYNYRIVKITETTPDDIDYVLPKTKEVLTVYTCSGIFDSKRFIIVANPE